MVIETYRQMKHYIDTNDVKSLAALIEQGTDIDLADAKKVTLLMAACFSGSAEIIALLLNHGADLNIKSKLGKTALDYAIQTQNTIALKILLDYMSRMDAEGQRKMKKIRLGILFQ